LFKIHNLEINGVLLNSKIKKNSQIGSNVNVKFKYKLKVYLIFKLNVFINIKDN
jgi:hypothetical protein